MEGEGLVAVVRETREDGLAVMLLHGNRQFTIQPKSAPQTQPGSCQHTPASLENASTQQCIPKPSVDVSTEPSASQPPKCDRDVQAVDGSYASVYQTTHCNLRPTSPPVQITEFPPQRPDNYPGHGNFIVGGGGSWVTRTPGKPTCKVSATPTFRGGMSWPDKGSVCAPRPSREVDAFVKSLRKYPCLSPDRSSEIMERLVNYSQAKGIRRFSRNSSSPTRVAEPSSYTNTIESKSTSARVPLRYEPDVCIRAKKTDDPPTRDWKRDRYNDTRSLRVYDIKTVRDNVKPYTTYPYSHTVCPPTIVENQEYNHLPNDFQNSSNSVSTEVQAAVKMLSKEVATLPRKPVTTKTVAVPESPICSAGEDYVEGECHCVENLDIRTSNKSIQTNSCPSDTTLKPRKSAQTVMSTIDFNATRKTVVSRKTKSQDHIKLTKEELKMTLLELINEASGSGCKNTIRDELIQKIFVAADSQSDDINDRGFTHDHIKNHNYVPNAYSPVCDYVGDYQELVGKLKHCFEQSKHVVRSEISTFRMDEHKQLDFVLKDWISNLNLKHRDEYMDTSEILNYLEHSIKEILKSWTEQDFDLKSEIVNVLLEIPIEINERYNAKSYLEKQVDVLLKRMRNVIVSPHTTRVQRKPFSSRPSKILTEKEIRDFLRAHLLDYFAEFNPIVCDDVLVNLENELVDLMIDSIDCIRCGHIDDFMDEMDAILQDIGQMDVKDANYISNIILQDLPELLNSSHFNQTYMVLNVSNNSSGPYMNSTNSTDFSIESLNEKDLNANLDRYTNELCLQINQWLDTLNIPRIQDSSFREVVVNDLADDIVDRQKYINLNHTDKDTAHDQLEALKYQIFKWINKLVGDDNQETLGHAETLLQMINSVPVPMFVYPKHTAQGINSTRPSYEADFCPSNRKDGQPYSNTAQEIQDFPVALPHTEPTGNVSFNQCRQADNAYASQGQCISHREALGNSSFSPNNPWRTNTFSSDFETSSINNISQISGRTNGCMDPNRQCMYGELVQSSSTPLSISIKKLNEDYDEYLKQWVTRIPIPANTPADQQAAETARLILYNEIWKCVTKMKLDPNIFSNNKYYCQDFFEKEIDWLLQGLPQSQELDAAKPTMKEQLLQKTLAMNNLIKSTNAPASFKQQLVDNIENNLPERTPTEDEEDIQNEKIEKQDLGDFYILYTRYKDEDNVKATFYKKKFLKKLDEFLEKIKNKHNKADMNKMAYANEIIDYFDKIPLPNISVIKQEADDIMLAMEVENWISDIPQNSTTPTCPFEKRRIRDAIVKKIHEIIESLGFYDNTLRALMKAELPKYLEKLPIQEGTNVEYIIDELANRIQKLLTYEPRVSFRAPRNYDDFNRNMPAASSFQDMPELESSYCVVGGNIVKDAGPGRSTWMNSKQPVTEEDIEWFSMEQTQMPANMGSHVPQSIRSPQVFFPTADHMHSVRSYRGENIVRGAGPMQDSRMPSNMRNWSARPKCMRSQPYNPNESGQIPTSRSCPGEENFIRNSGPSTSMPAEEFEWLSMEETQMPSNLRDWSKIPQSMHSSQRYIPSEAGPMSNSKIYFEDANEVPSQFPPNTQIYFDPNDQRPFFPNVQDAQGQFSSNLQGGQVYTGPQCCPNPACLQSRGFLRSESFLEPASRSPGLYGQGSPARGNAAQTSSLPRASYGQGSPDRRNQRFEPVLNQVGPRESGGQPYIEPHSTTCPNIGQGQGSVLNANGQNVGPYAHYSRGSLGKVANHKPHGTQGQLGQDPWPNVPGYPQTGQAFIHEVVKGSGQGNMNGQHNATAEVQASMHSTLHQTSQSPGPVSAASQMPDQASRPHNFQKMANGGVGILGTSQEEGPSGRIQSIRIGITPNTPSIGAQQAVRSQNQPGDRNLTDNIGVNQMNDQNIGVQQPTATNQNRQAYCVPPCFMSRAIEYSTSSRPFADQRPREIFREPRQDAEGAQGRFNTDDTDSVREREGCQCISRRRRWRLRTDPDDGHEVEYPCLPRARYPYNQTVHCSCGTIQKRKPAKELENNQKLLKELADINDKEPFSVDSLQTASSVTDKTFTKSKYGETKSKSQEELTKEVKCEYVVKRTGLGSGDLQQQQTEWLKVNNDKTQIKLLGLKMKNLAEIIKKPGGEKKLRTKIEKYLTPPELSLKDGDENKEFKRQSSNEIVRQLKNIYSTPAETNMKVYCTKTNYSSRSNLEYFRKAVLNWINNLNIKTKDFLGRSVKKDDVLKYVCDKLEPLVLDRPQSDSEYKIALKSNITEIITELPLVFSTHNKEFHLDKITENLVNDIFDSCRKHPSPYIQPTIKEIKDFIKDEITFFYKKCHVAISTKRMECLEKELMNLILDLKNITDLDQDLIDDVTTLFKELGKLPVYKAKYVTNLLFKDYIEFFFRENYFKLKGEQYNGRPEVYAAFHNANDLEESFEIYRQQLVEEINKWVTKLNVTYDKNFTEAVSKDITSDIVDRYQYMLLHPSIKRTDAEELAHLKFLIFKWKNKLVGEKNISDAAAEELINKIMNIAKPSLQNTTQVTTSPQSNDSINNTDKSYVDILIEQVYNWYYELNKDLHVSKDPNENKLIIKEFAEEIERGFQKEGVIEKEVEKWTEKIFNEKLSKHDLELLKNRINNIPNIINNRANNVEGDNALIRLYEDIVAEWIDTIDIEPNKLEFFNNNKNKFVHTIALKILKTQTKIKHLPAEVVEQKLQEKLSYWLKRLPLHERISNENYRDNYAANLIKSMQKHNIIDSLENQQKHHAEKVMLEELKIMPLFKEKSSKEKQLQKTSIKELADRLNRIVIDNQGAMINEDIFEHTRMLEPELDNEYVKNTANQLKLYLQKLDEYNGLREQHEREIIFLEKTIEVWLKSLPLNVSDVNQFKKQITEFIKNIKQLITSGSDKVSMRKNILMLTRSLPIIHKKKYDSKYLNEEISKLIQSLMAFTGSDVPSQSPQKTNKIVRDAIEEWIKTLRLKPVHCPMELRSLIGDMSLAITLLILSPEQNLIRENDDMILKTEIVKYLRKFPLFPELSTERHISRMAEKLSDTLKNISWSRNDNGTKLNNVIVYDVSVGNTNITDDFSNKSIKGNYINGDLATYKKQLVKQISEWFDNLNLPTQPKDDFKEVVINDLAEDIVDRHKYLELNPNHKGTKEDEFKLLKYQIFKWINNLVGEETLETIGHAEELMQMINQIPVPMLVIPQDKGQAQTVSLKHTESQQSGSQTINSSKKTSQTGQPAVSFRVSSTTGQQAPSHRNSRSSSPNGLANTDSAPCCSQDPPPASPPPLEGSKAALYHKYVNIFREACDGLAIDESSPYAGVAKTAIYNGILKAFFNLKSNPDIENDYGYFEFILEEKLDKFLDVLPQTEELKRQRYSWKTNILKHAIGLLEELHKLSDRPCFRQLVKNKFNRQFALEYELEHCFLLQQGFLAAMADAYILETNYKEKDPVKASIYRNRLMKKVDDLANHLSKEHNAGFRFFDIAKLHRLALKVLDQVPIPTDDILQDEVEEIHLADEVEKWYKELPTQPIRNESDGVLRKRMMDLLAKKLHDMHKYLSDDDPSKEARIKHEMSIFLEKRAELQQDQDLNINFMVEQLHNRLKNRWLNVHEPAEYDDFANFKPLSSTLAHVDDAEFLAPLIDGATSTGPQQAQESTGQRTLRYQGERDRYFMQPGQPMQSNGQSRTSYGAGLYGRHSLQDPVRLGSPQAAGMRSMDPNFLRQGRNRIGHDGTSQGYMSHQGVPSYSIQAPESPRSIHEGYITRQRQANPNMSLPARRQVVRPQLYQSIGHSPPRNSRRAQIGNQREQNINQSLRQVELASQVERQDLRQNMPSQMQRSARSGSPQGQLFVPSHQGRASQQSRSVTPGHMFSSGPTPSQGAGTTAEAATGSRAAPFSSERDISDDEYPVKCKCLEAIRRRIRYCNNRPCDMYIPY